MSIPIPDGGAAFPQHGWSSNPDLVERMSKCGGMSLRDWFAGKALIAVVAGGDENGGLYPATYLDEKGEETYRATPPRFAGDDEPKPNTLIRSSEDNTANASYRLADAMLKAREAKP